ncbi:hypothetical protein SELMODRAFT_444678 [Selaginella moellendorffii]|uniref:Ribosome biogenesis protein SLX9 n=1 Tax=Selaginella moellendorffii TaxID=88036 RepID=D8SC06_SELML|nr:hypothetical protein SELMODRAFT_444678 [Selaginella moellendorffii]
MDLEGEKVDGLTIARVLDACGETSQTLALAEELGEGFSYGDFDIQIGNSLLNVYAKSRDLDAAKCLFERMKNKDVVSFNTLMGIYAQLGLDSDCVKTFHGMQLQGVRPNNISYANVLDACSNLSALTSGKAIHESMKASGITPDLVKKKTIRQKVREKSAKVQEKKTEEENETKNVEAEREIKPSVRRKLAKQERFLAKLRETQTALAKAKKKSKPKRRNTRTTLQDLSSLGEFLPDVPNQHRVCTKKSNMKQKHRQQLIIRETKQLAAVLSHPQFQQDPYAAVHQHLVNTVPEYDHKKAK